MLEIPEEIKDLFRRDNLAEETRKKIKLDFPQIGLVIENDRIESESMAITESLSETEEMEFGSCDSAMFEITVADVVQDVTGLECFVSLRVNGYEIPLGFYTVESFVRQADRRKKKITAYDRMSRFSKDVSDWYNGLSFPITIKAFRDSLCNYVGVGQEAAQLPLDDMKISKTVEPAELSGLDVLKAICQINGCFGHVRKNGKLSYIFLQQTGLYPSETLYPQETLYPAELGGDGVPFETISHYKEAFYEDYVVQGISGILIRQEEGDVGVRVGEPENTYIVEGNFLVYGKTASELEVIANAILGKVYGRTYRPASVTCYGMPWLEVGDAVRMPTRDDVVEMFAMKRTLSGIQALMDSLESTGSQTREEVFGIGKQIIQLEGRTAIITKNVDEVSVKLSDLRESTETELEITHGLISAEVKRATSAEGELSGKISVEADRITTEVKRATSAEGTLSSQIEQTAEKIALKVNVGDVSSELSIEKGDITITGNRFSWSATNSSMTKDGILTCSGGTFKGDVTADNFKVNSSIKIYLGDQTQYTDIVKMVFDDGSSDMHNTYYNLQIGAANGTVISSEQISAGEIKYNRLSGVSIPTRLNVSEDLNVAGEIIGYRGVKGITVKGGTIVKTVSTNTSIPMFSDAEISTILGVYGSSISNTIMLFANGDGNAQAAHIDGSTHMNGTWYATTDRTMTAGNFRVNWVAVYFG